MSERKFNFYTAYRLDGKKLGLLEQRNENKIKGNYLKGVTCFVVDIETGEVMLEQRKNKGLTPGKIDLVSGHIDNDETPIQAMTRELREEVGIDLQQEPRSLQKFEEIPLSFESKGEYRKFFIQFFCLMRESRKVVIQPEEVEKVFWVPMEEAFRMIREGETKFPKGDMYETIFSKIEELYKKIKNPQLTNGIGRE